jgi:hypothetical protein
VGIAELHETGSFGVFDDAALERNRPKFISLSAARAHRMLLSVNFTPYSYIRLEQDRPNGQFLAGFEELGLGVTRHSDRRDTGESGSSQ